MQRTGLKEACKLWLPCSRALSVWCTCTASLPRVASMQPLQVGKQIKTLAKLGHCHAAMLARCVGLCRPGHLLHV